MSTDRKKNLLFLCTGNYYRSRFAEYFFNNLAEKQKLNWKADSRGLAIEYGVNNIGPISPHAVQGLTERGIIMSANERLPCQATEMDFMAADKIIALDESEHRPLMIARFPRWADTIHYWLVHDLDKTSPEHALKQIEQHIHDVIKLLVAV